MIEGVGMSKGWEEGRRGWRWCGMERWWGLTLAPNDPKILVLSDSQAANTNRKSQDEGVGGSCRGYWGEAG